MRRILGSADVHTMAVYSAHGNLLAVGPTRIPLLDRLLSRAQAVRLDVIEKGVAARATIVLRDGQCAARLRVSTDPKADIHLSTTDFEPGDTVDLRSLILDTVRTQHIGTVYR